MSPQMVKVCISDWNSEKSSVLREKETNAYEEQSQERKDLAKVVVQFLEPFIVVGEGAQDSNSAVSCSLPCPDVVANPVYTEFDEVTTFVKETSKNYGAYHMDHLLLEEVASRAILYRDTIALFLELEKLTRQWGRDRTRECSLFLAELYYDFGSRSSDTSRQSDFMSDASYHLCKIIESIATDYPFHIIGASEDENSSSTSSSQCNSETSVGNSSPLSNNSHFWVRFFWLSGRLSIFDGDRAKAQQEFCISLSHLSNEENLNNHLRSVCLPHCKVIKELTVDRILHEINLLEVDFLLKGAAIGQIIEKEMYLECAHLHAPLPFSTMDTHQDISWVADNKGDEIASVELSALDVLIKACEKAKPTDFEVFLNCCRRKLQILLVAAGMDECLASHKSIHKMSVLKPLSASETELNESPSMHWNQLVAEEVKAISQCASQMKTFIDLSGNSNGFIALLRIIGDFQSLLLTLMCNIVSTYFSKKSAGPAISDQIEQSRRYCFIDSAILICKLQHLNPNVPIKTQIELIVAMHDLLAEYGLCCAGNRGRNISKTCNKASIVLGYEA
ncbi:Calcineurin-binding protein 1 [Camellia lanceoleosa]|uniref:Calcineurin-binding protein 1 n=1 Tax=Camellia lanceoleosa TaxID=1840588 RepID=A0ACC0FH25_9ERIC|nr:Calcineurin-binding protein 1 [Camellia lanceoleosa]